MRQCAQAALAIASLTLCLTAGSPVAEAQVRGIPVNNSGVASGIALYGDVGFPDEQAGKGTAYALTGRAGFGAFGATAMISTFDPEGDAGGAVRRAGKKLRTPRAQGRGVDAGQGGDDAVQVAGALCGRRFGGWGRVRRQGKVNLVRVRQRGDSKGGDRHPDGFDQQGGLAPPSMFRSMSRGAALALA